MFGVAPFLVRDLSLAVSALPTEQLVKAQTLGASTWQLAIRVVLPQVMPRLLEAVRLSLGPAFLFLISAEAIAADVGLGYRIFLVRRYLAMDIILPYVAWITLLAPVPLPFNEPLEWPALFVYELVLVYFLQRLERGHAMVLPNWVLNVLGLVYLPLLPVRLVELMRARGIAFVEVPEGEFASMGCNVLALGPRRALALDGNPETRRRLEAAGVEVRTYRGEELSRKGDGGPTCLTRPLARG